MCGSQYHRTTIGSLIDEYMENTPGLIDAYPNDTEFLALPKGYLKILAADAKGVVVIFDSSVI